MGSQGILLLLSHPLKKKERTSDWKPLNDKLIHLQVPQEREREQQWGFNAMRWFSRIQIKFTKFEILPISTWYWSECLMRREESSLGLISFERCYQSRFAIHLCSCNPHAIKLKANSQLTNIACKTNWTYVQALSKNKRTKGRNVINDANQTRWTSQLAIFDFDLVIDENEMVRLRESQQTRCNEL